MFWGADSKRNIESYGCVDKHIGNDGGMEFREIKMLALK